MFPEGVELLERPLVSRSGISVPVMTVSGDRGNRGVQIQAKNSWYNLLGKANLRMLRPVRSQTWAVQRATSTGSLSRLAGDED